MAAVDHRREYDLAAEAAARLEQHGFGDAVAAVQTGSGLGAPPLDGAVRLPWTEIPGFPRATAPGHSGALVFGRQGGVPVLYLEGRLHGYEGHELAEVVRPVRAVGLLGVRHLILTNASGGVREGLAPGTVVRVADHVNLMGADPLRGIHDPRFGERFPVTAGRSHDAELGRVAEEVARAAGVRLVHGVYGGLHGPSFETPAEVRRLRLFGIDVVGMSTVPEILAATQLRLRTLVLALVVNPAGQVADGATAESEVVDVAGRESHGLARVVAGVIAHIGAGVRTEAGR